MPTRKCAIIFIYALLIARLAEAQPIDGQPGSEIRCTIPTDARNATDRSVSLNWCCPSKSVSKSGSTVSPDASIQSWPLTPTDRVYSAQCINCFNQQQPEGVEQCNGGVVLKLPESRYGLLCGVALLWVLAKRRGR